MRYWNYRIDAYNVRAIPNSVLEQVPARPGVWYPQIWQNLAVA